MIYKFLCIISIILFPSPAVADFIATLTGVATPQSDGTILYQYTLNVLPDSTLPSNGLSINVDQSANLSGISPGPTGWDTLYNPGEPLITWAADQFSPYLPPGSSTTFSFTSTLPPVQQDFVIFGLDSSGQIDGEVDGQVFAPGTSAVPEPTSMIPLGTGLTILACYVSYRHSRRQ